MKPSTSMDDVHRDFPPTESPLPQQEDDTSTTPQLNPPFALPPSPPSVFSDEEETARDSDDASDDDEFGPFKRPNNFDKRYYTKVEKMILEEDTEELLWLAKNKPLSCHVNLMNDPVLSVVIARRKTEIALELIKQLPNDKLEAHNCNGDTALHVAAASGDTKAANALLNKSLYLAEKRNKKGEKPLHKAALYGQQEVFQLLVDKAKGKCSPEDRTYEGANSLHCAIMGNAPGLALKIAMDRPNLAETRNNRAVTPLQLLVTIPEAFRSQLVLGSLDNFLYDSIPLPEEPPKRSRKQGIIDIEDQGIHGDNSEEIEKEEDEERGKWISMLFRNILGPIRIWLFKLLWRVSPKIQKLYEQKVVHRDAMKLIEWLAKHSNNFEFFAKGHTNDYTMEASWRRELHGNRERKTGQKSQQRELLLKFVNKLLSLDDGTRGSDAPVVKGVLQSATKALESMSSVRSFSESPLIMGAEMGLNEFVKKILEVCPESATYVDSRRRNVLQVAIESGNREIVETIRQMTAGDKPVLPSWLLSHTKSRGTILHFASERIPPDTDDDAVQMQDELIFFETVKEMVPRELMYSRNKEEKTAQEVFSENHKEMLKRCKNQLMEMGKTCAGLVAAVVFASSFSIPGEKDEKTGNPVYMDRLAFKIFSHTYVIGLSCAATSLILFLSLVISPYKEQQFRRAIPTKYFLACLSFAMALFALLVSFTCNIFLQIYGGQRTESGDLIPLILELIVFPVLCLIILYYRGATFWPSFRRIWK
ncbi:uncharacterized protein LOC141837258 [Curcuma longa]|uniref:uncharacterized protein LOC141837258 n=1 Tax=Curcuma longa TaxID=136217 RepID=UPI003D9F2EC9